MIRLLERCVYQSELLHASESIDQDKLICLQKGLSSIIGLIKCQYKWLKWLDDDANMLESSLLILERHSTTYHMIF